MVHLPSGEERVSLSSHIDPKGVVGQSVQQLPLRHSQAAGTGADQEAWEGLVGPEPFKKTNLCSLHVTDREHESGTMRVALTRIATSVRALTSVSSPLRRASCLVRTGAEAVVGSRAQRSTHDHMNCQAEASL